MLLVEVVVNGLLLLGRRSVLDRRQDSRAERGRRRQTQGGRVGSTKKRGLHSPSLLLPSSGLIAWFLVPAILPRLRGPRASRHQHVAIAQASPANFVVRKRTYAVVDEDLPSSDPHTGCRRSLPLPPLFPFLA